MNVPVVRIVLRCLAAGIFISAGIMHFLHPRSFERIVPPSFPKPALLVAVSGVCEIVGGVSLLIRPLRRPARWGLIAMLIAVFPANIYMATNARAAGAENIPAWLLWARLPFQAVLIAWVWFVSID